MRTATLVEDHGERGDVPGCVRGGAKAVYRLSEPIVYDSEKPPADFVYVSSATILGTPETYAFPCDAKGEVLSWAELDGSQKGDASHADVLRDMGFTLVATERRSEDR